MKNLRSILLSLGALLLVIQFAFVSPAAAQSAKKLERERVSRIMQPTADVEAFRQEYLNYLTEMEDGMRLLNTVPEVRERLSRSGLKPISIIAEAKRTVAEYSTEDLMKIRAAYAKFPGWREAPQALVNPQLRGQLEAKLAAGKTGRFTADAATTDSCEDALKAGITNTDIAIAKAVLIAAQAAADVIPPVLNAVAVAAVAVADGAVLSLETLKATKDDCEGNAFQEAITTQLTNSVANDNANTTTIMTAISNAQTAIVNNDNSNKTAIINNDNSNRDTIVNNDNANTLKITNAVEAAKTTIIVNANANKDELIRLHIAADLASTDGSTFVAAFMLPASEGGYLELVRSIVAQTIAKLAGSKTAQANAFLQKGDAFRAAGDYKAAYAEYRKAYKTAQN